MRGKQIFEGMFPSVWKSFICSWWGPSLLFLFFLISTFWVFFQDRNCVCIQTKGEAKESAKMFAHVRIWKCIHVHSSEERFLKHTVVVWWSADMQASYTYLLRRGIYLLKILSSWIIQCEIHLLLFVWKPCQSLDMRLKNEQKPFSSTWGAWIVTYLVCVKMRWKGAYM